MRLHLQCVVLSLAAALVACSIEPAGFREPVCGNGEVEAGEGCDDGNTVLEACAYGATSCVVCDATCQPVGGAVSVCGDAAVDLAHEVCDDGNARNWDGCNVDCTLSGALAYVKASNTEGSDYFGYSIALSADGTTLAVGGVIEDSAATGIDGDQASNAAQQSGAVYVFVRSGATWVQQAYLKASNTGAGDDFGFSVALSADGSTLAVGAIAESSAATGIDGNQADNTASVSGAVYVFTRSGATWSQQAYVKASNTGTSDQFGWSVALSCDGSTLAVGARLEDSAATGIDGNQADNTITDSGAVYVFTRSGATWSQQAYAKASNPGANDHFGISVALSGDGSTLAGCPSQVLSATLSFRSRRTDQESK
jgi:cysteine-rich repeat protein